MVKAVIFDMFETLVTLFEGRTYYSEDIAADTGVDENEFRKHWHFTEHDRTTGKMTVEEGLAYAFEKLGVNSAENVQRAERKRLEALGDTFSAIPEESLGLLKGLRKRGIKTGLITNTFSDECALIKASELYPLFDEAVISYEVGICKPDPGIYRTAVERLGVRAEDCLYVGDGGSGELFAARDMGMKAVQAAWFRERAFEPHIPCRELEGFRQVIYQADILDIAEKL